MDDFRLVERNLDEYYGEGAEDFKRWAKHDFEVAVTDMGGVCNFVCNLRWCAVNKNYTGRQKETPEENLETVAGVRENPNTLRRNMLGFWWRRGESNPCPKTIPQDFLRVQTVIYIPFPRRESSHCAGW